MWYSCMHLCGGGGGCMHIAGNFMEFPDLIMEFNPNHPQSNKIQQGEVKKMR